MVFLAAAFLSGGTKSHGKKFSSAMEKQGQKVEAFYFLVRSKKIAKVDGGSEEEEEEQE